ncbi:phage integrase SAM-like domain-containing protein [Winogradskyella sp.]|jgi:site-specific recombinase XerD|uniref:tyrosine-type recombinase/integrase n=1 Tax=Winogradskyella sp. TaxID=1883156 RepID=UPI0025D1E5FC|nr:phage integrase SAM-like domain-containing protein [Winogradskyella sp.]MCT4629597.1 site-specific integrase [Winogradskyella sp.]
MAKLSYNIRETKDGGGTIQLYFNYGTNKRLRYSTKFKVKKLKNWDKDNSRVRNVADELDRHLINNKLNDLKTTLENKYTELLVNKEIINNDILTEICDLCLGRVIAENKIEFLELLPFYKWFTENYSQNPLMSTGRPLKKGTAKTYKNAYTILKRFNDEVYKISYRKINMAFYQDFLNWLYLQNYSNNYIGTQIKILKTMLNASLEFEHHNNLEHKRRYFKKPVEEIDHIYLNNEELNKIFSLDFTNTKPIRISKSLYLTPDKLNNARDLFLISANTGLRVSDFHKLNSRIEKDGKSFFKLITKKNSKPLFIPINSTVQAILNKYDNNPPSNMPDQHINYALKEIGKLAKIDDRVTIERTIGGKLIKKDYKKHELISNHTGRRSFCTNAYMSGIPESEVMTISGHSTIAVFRNYIKVGKLERVQKISDYEFFN